MAIGEVQWRWYIGIWFESAHVQNAPVVLVNRPHLLAYSCVYRDITNAITDALYVFDHLAPESLPPACPSCRRAFSEDS